MYSVESKVDFRISVTKLMEGDVHGEISGTNSAFVGRVEENSEDTRLVDSVPRPTSLMNSSRRKLRKRPLLFLKCFQFNYFFISLC